MACWVGAHPAGSAPQYTTSGFVKLRRPKLVLPREGSEMFGLRTQFIGRAMPATSTSEDKIRALGQTLATIEFAMDGTILDANPNFLTIVDCGAAEIRGQHHSVLIDAQEATSETYRLFWQALREGQPRKVEHRRVNGNGREVWLQASYNPIRDRHGRLISVFTLAYDVT